MSGPEQTPGLFYGAASPLQSGTGFIYLCIPSIYNKIWLTGCLLNNRVHFFWLITVDKPFVSFLPVPFYGICFTAGIRIQKLSLACFLFHKPLFLKTILYTFFAKTEFPHLYSKNFLPKKKETHWKGA